MMFSKNTNEILKGLQKPLWKNMGDRYWLKLNCAYCGKLNNPENELGIDGVYYAPSSGWTTFRCEHCGKENKIVQSFTAKKI